MVPTWLHILALVALVLGCLSAIIIALDETTHPQHMWIMNVVWPVTALFGGLLWLWGYFHYGRLATHERMQADKNAAKHKPFAVMVATGTSHCGSGCALGDLCAEWLVFALPPTALWFGWQTIFAEKIFAVWILDFLLAYLFGVAFQYFSISPMRGLNFADGLWAAIKADTLSLTAWQLGMYGFMAIAQFWIFRATLGVDLEVDSVEFWFMMQIAMLCGFLTSYPVNWWLLRAGIKEPM